MIKRCCLILSLIGLLYSPSFAQEFDEGFHRFAFYATLEGLYEMNLSNATVDMVLEIEPQTGFPTNFVYSCPVCHPVYDAFNLYRQRPKRLGNKRGLRQFTIEEGVWEKRLAVKDPEKRTKVLGQLVKELFAKKLDSMNLTLAERGNWNSRIIRAHNAGGEALKRLKAIKGQGQLIPSWMNKCQVCEGAEEAAEGN